jgi:hypothetical protein
MPAVTATALSLLLLADAQPASHKPDRVHAVLGWTDHGPAIYRPLGRTVDATAQSRAQLALFDTTPPASEQLRLDVGDDAVAYPSSCGLTWRTWALQTIPPSLRHLPPAGVVRELTRRLEA